jgi:hypothetical protein
VPCCMEDGKDVKHFCTQCGFFIGTLPVLESK